MTNQELFLFRVTDLKQYAYCGRILYYHTVLPQVRPLTYKMEAGIQAHIQAEKREKRRSLRTYGLQEGDRFFNVPVVSPELMLSGEIDMVIETKTELMPVDYKMSRGDGHHFRLQLMAYGRLLEMVWAGETKPIKRGFLYLIPRRTAVEVRFTPSLRRQLDNALTDMRRIMTQQQMPLPTKYRRRCVDCEFRRFCNDV